MATFAKVKDKNIWHIKNSNSFENCPAIHIFNLVVKT